MAITPGSRFCRLLVTGEGPVNGRTYTSLCTCDCGSEKTVSSSDLKRGRIKSCGCLKAELTRVRMRTHGMSRSSEYAVWKQMIARCANKNNKKFPIYGGRGISVCDRWMNSFEDFIGDMGPRPAGRFSVDRINGDGNYEPSNCRWASTREQGNNRRTNIVFEVAGRKQNLTQWSKEIGVNRQTLRSRIDRSSESPESVLKGLLENESHAGN